MIDLHVGGTGGPSPLLIAGIAFCGVVFASLLSAWISSRNLYVNSVTVERSKWIEALRLNLATMAARLRHISYKNPNDGKPYVADPDDVHEVSRLIAVLVLQLNPRGLIDGNVLRLLSVMPKLAEGQRLDRLALAEDYLMGHAQFLLKAEWEKVKAEARLLPFSYWAGAWRRHEEYKKYCKTKDPIGLLVLFAGGPNP